MLLNLGQTLQGKVLSGVGWLRYILMERYYFYTIRVGIVITTIALTSLSAAIIVNRGGILSFVVVGALAGLFVFVIVYNYLEYGCLVLLFASTVGNFGLPNNLSTTLLLLLLLLFIWFAKMIVADRNFSKLRPAAPNKFVFLFAFAVIISFIWSSFYVDPNISYFQNQKFLPRTLTAIVLIISPLTILFYGNIFRSIKLIKQFIWFFIIFGGFIGIARLLRLEFLGFLNDGGQIAAWTSILAFGQILFNKSLKRWQVLFLTGVIGFWVYKSLGFGITWLSGWMPLTLGLVIMIMLHSRRMFILAIIVLSFGAFHYREQLSEAFFDEQEESGNTRAEAAGTVLDIAHEHFLFGTGPAGYYFYMTVNVGGFFQLTHNNYLDIYAQTGVFGFATWVLLWLSVGWVLWQVYRSKPQDDFVRGLSLSLIAIYPMSLMLMMLGDWLTPFTYTGGLNGISYAIWPWMFAGIGLSLYHQLPKLASEN